MKNICDIIVLTWNQKQIIKSFIDSLFKSTSLPFRLIIIDNNSKDGTREYLESIKKDNVKIIFNKENRGFVGGMNQGIEISDAPYVCLANNDLIFTKGWLEEIIFIFENYPKVGILNPDSNSLGAKPPEDVSIEEFAETLKINNKGIFLEMPFCIGFCMCIRREVIERIGKLSEDFAPIFFEDTDYSMRAKSAGYLIGVAKGSYVWHKEHASFKQIKEREAIFQRNRNIFIKKWGKILRIAWISTDYNELKNNLKNAIDFARQGNFIFFFFKGFKLERSRIFEEIDSFEHTGIIFLRFKNIFDLAFKIIKKKKKYDVIFGPYRIIKRLKFLRLFYKSYFVNQEDKNKVLNIYKKIKYENSVNFK